MHDSQSGSAIAMDRSQIVFFLFAVVAVVVAVVVAAAIVL